MTSFYFFKFSSACVDSFLYVFCHLLLIWDSIFHVRELQQCLTTLSSLLRFGLNSQSEVPSV
jgi:hypothetical protein